MSCALQLIVLVAAFYILFKSADFFVDGAVGLATDFGVPKLIIGIVLVGFATTAPEFFVSVMAAYRGQPEIALGNAIGSVLADDGLALPMVGIFSVSVVLIDKKILKTAGIFLITVDVIAYLLAFNRHINRIEGLLLLFFLGVYLVYVVRTESARMRNRNSQPPREEKAIEEAGNLKRDIVYFALGLAGVVYASHFVIESAIKIAETFHISKTIIALTIVALGTSLPEVATCVTAARRGEGQIAVGNIIGADILNICWIIGMSAVVNPISVSRIEINFMFPTMLVIVITMLVLMRINYRWDRKRGIILLTLYGLYLLLAFKIFYFKSPWPFS